MPHRTSFVSGQLNCQITLAILFALWSGQGTFYGKKKTTTTTKLKSDRSLFRSFYYELSLSFFEQNDHGEEIDLETKRLTTSSLSFFLVRRRKRAIHENDHARD